MPTVNTIIEKTDNTDSTPSNKNILIDDSYTVIDCTTRTKNCRVL